MVLADMREELYIGVGSDEHGEKRIKDAMKILGPSVHGSCR